MKLEQSQKLHPCLIPFTVSGSAIKVTRGEKVPRFISSSESYNLRDKSRQDMLACTIEALCHGHQQIFSNWALPQTGIQAYNYKPGLEKSMTKEIITLDGGGGGTKHRCSVRLTVSNCLLRTHVYIHRQLLLLALTREATFSSEWQ